MSYDGAFNVSWQLTLNHKRAGFRLISWLARLARTISHVLDGRYTPPSCRCARSNVVSRARISGKRRCPSSGFAHDLARGPKPGSDSRLVAGEVTLARELREDPSVPSPRCLRCKSFAFVATAKQLWALHGLLQPRKSRAWRCVGSSEASWSGCTERRPARRARGRVPLRRARDWPRPETRTCESRPCTSQEGPTILRLF
jgi:hypothetical protein